MANKPLDTAFVDKAIKFAVDAHAGTERRGKGFPYVIHVLEAMSITAYYTNDPEILAAAALHDTVEDTDVTVEQIRAEFGDRVAQLVHSETDVFEEVDDWRARKQAAIDRIAASSHDVKLVAIGDKLSNMRAIAADYHQIGDKLWDRFHAPNGKEDHEWHYRGLARALSDLAGSDPYTEFSRLIHSVFGAPKPELVDMADYEESGDGFTAISYNHKGGTTMMKLYAEYIPAFVPSRELAVSRALTDMGLNTPLALRMVTDGKRIGIEFERVLNKRSFARAISQEPEKLEEYSRQFARLCKKLHQTNCDTSVFEPGRNRFINAVKKSPYTEEEKKKMLDFIDSIPMQQTCMHGDMHIGNALIANGKEYWIDLADFAYDNPIFDMGMFYFVIWGSNNEELTQKLFHISIKQFRQVWDYFVDEYYGPEADNEEIKKKIAPVAALYMVNFDMRGDGIDPEMRQFIREKLLAND